MLANIDIQIFQLKENKRNSFQDAWEKQNNFNKYKLQRKLNIKSNLVICQNIKKGRIWP